MLKSKVKEHALKVNEYQQQNHMSNIIRCHPDSLVVNKLNQLFSIFIVKLKHWFLSGSICFHYQLDTLSFGNSGNWRKAHKVRNSIRGLKSNKTVQSHGKVIALLLVLSGSPKTGGFHDQALFNNHLSNIWNSHQLSAQAKGSYNCLYI